MSDDKGNVKPFVASRTQQDSDTVLLLGVPPQLVQSIVNLLDSEVSGEKGQQARAICNSLEQCPQLDVPRSSLEPKGQPTG